MAVTFFGTPPLGVEAGLSGGGSCGKAEPVTQGEALPRAEKGSEGQTPGQSRTLAPQPSICPFSLSGFEPETYWDRMHLFQEAIAHRFVPSRERTAGGPSRSSGMAVPRAKPRWFHFRGSRSSPPMSRALLISDRTRPWFLRLLFLRPDFCRLPVEGRAELPP